MPWPPHPFTFTCPQCHWCKTTVPPSDALREGVDWFSNGPSCRHTALDVRPATVEHFHTKLLKLASGFKTAEGARLAAERHARLEVFLADFMDEIGAGGAGVK